MTPLVTTLRKLDFKKMCRGMGPQKPVCWLDLFLIWIVVFCFFKLYLYHLLVNVYYSCFEFVIWELCSSQV